MVGTYLFFSKAALRVLSAPVEPTLNSHQRAPCYRLEGQSHVMQHKATGFTMKLLASHLREFGLKNSPAVHDGSLMPLV